MEEFDRAHSENPPVSPLPETANPGPLGRAGALLNFMRSRGTATSTSAQAQPEFVELPENDDESETHTFYTVDTGPPDLNAVQPAPVVDRQCPDTLEEMLVIVRKLRLERQALLQTQRDQEASVVTPAVEQRRADKQANSNNFRRTNMAHFYDFDNFEEGL